MPFGMDIFGHSRNQLLMERQGLERETACILESGHNNNVNNPYSRIISLLDSFLTAIIRHVLSSSYSILKIWPDFSL
jgi:hypothetical protein